MAVLTELERRHIAHLSIPRNIVDLDIRLRSDPYVPARVEVDEHGNDVYENGQPKLIELDDYLGRLKEKGFIVELAEEDDPLKMATAAQRHSSSVDLHDDSVEILARRLARPDLSWRAQGRKYILSKTGLEAIKEPVVASPVKGAEEINGLIAMEWQRVVHDGEDEGWRFVGSIHDQGDGPRDHRAGGMIVDLDGNPFEYDENGDPINGNGGPSLSSRLLIEEYKDWEAAVVEEFVARYPKELQKTARKQLRLPIAGGASGYSDAYEIIILDAENQKSSITAAAPWFLALSLVAITDADTGTTLDDGTHKPTYTGYARISIAAADMNAGSGTSGAVTNANAFTGAACTAGSSTAVAVGHCSAATVGTLRKWGDITSVTISTTQTPPTVGAGAYSTSVA